jgi:hypothetical protein
LLHIQSQAKVGQNDAIIFGNQDIRGFDIAMNNAVLVRVIQGAGRGSPNSQDFSQWHALAFVTVSPDHLAQI